MTPSTDGWASVYGIAHYGSTVEPIANVGTGRDTRRTPRNVAVLDRAKQQRSL